MYYIVVKKEIKNVVHLVGLELKIYVRNITYCKCNLEYSHVGIVDFS
jgi:hypothetical protein